MKKIVLLFVLTLPMTSFASGLFIPPRPARKPVVAVAASASQVDSSAAKETLKKGESSKTDSSPKVEDAKGQKN
jgi:hypothetical protein